MNFSDHGHARTKHLGVEFCFQSRSCAVCSAESPNILPSKRQKAHVLGNQHRCLCATSASSLWKTQQQLLPTLQMPSATTGTTSSATRESPVVWMRNDTRGEAMDSESEAESFSRGTSSALPGEYAGRPGSWLKPAVGLFSPFPLSLLWCGAQGPARLRVRLVALTTATSTVRALSAE